MRRTGCNNHPMGMEHIENTLIGYRHDAPPRPWKRLCTPAAQRCFLSLLQQGQHPDRIALAAREKQVMVPEGSYIWDFLQARINMHSDLQHAGSFRGFPSLAGIEAVERIVGKRILLERMVSDRFMMQTTDSLFSRNIDRHPTNFIADDRQQRPRLQERKSRMHNYFGEELHGLRRSMADMAFRLDTAEARLDTLPQRQIRQGVQSDSPMNPAGPIYNRSPDPMTDLF